MSDSLITLDPDWDMTVTLVNPGEFRQNKSLFAKLEADDMLKGLSATQVWEMLQDGLSTMEMKTNSSAGPSTPESKIYVAGDKTSDDDGEPGLDLTQQKVVLYGVSSKKMAAASTVFAAGIDRLTANGPQDPCAMDLCGDRDVVCQMLIPNIPDGLFAILLNMIHGHDSDDKVPTQLAPAYYLSQLAWGVNLFRLHDVAQPFGDVLIRNLSDGKEGLQWTRIQPIDVLDWWYFATVFRTGNEACYEDVMRSLSDRTERNATTVCRTAFPFPRHMRESVEYMKERILIMLALEAELNAFQD